MIKVLLNGERRELETAVTIVALLDHLKIDPRTVAVEHNRAVVKRARYAETMVDDGAEIEIVSFVGGG
jgi:thiamine biosynthesis protein ThiS